MSARSHVPSAIATICVLLAGVALPALTEGDAATPVEKPPSALLDPSAATARAPETFDVVLDTTKGLVTVRVHRAWAPNGADRFFNLVRLGYYDGCRFFRVIAGFMAQVGMHPDPGVNAAWSAAPIPDDPILQANTRGRVTFAARSTPDSRTTQFFINTVDNTRLAGYGAFAPFGEVVHGLEIVDALYAEYGEGAPNGRGPSQMRLATEGNAYLDRAFPNLDEIRTARIVE